MPSIDKAVQWAVAIAEDDSHGYDQANRQGPDYDCSSLVANALFVGGFTINQHSWTGNLREQLIQNGFTICTAPWRKGDIHLNEKYHVCMSVDAERVVEASINEKCTVTGGQTGDQTGHEISVKPYYTYKHGWDVHMRAPGFTAADAMALMQVAMMTMEGRYGNEPERSEKLKNAGFDPSKVQNVINMVYKELEK